MGGEWKTVRLGDICDITRGASPRPIHNWVSDVGVPWLKIADATNAGSRYIWKTDECIRPEAVSKSVAVVPGDLVLSNSATPGIPKFLAINACIHDGWLLLRNLRQLDKLFCYYLLLHEREKIVEQGNGSIFTNLKTSILKNHSVSVPPLPVQHRIADILGSLDDKIELNRRTNETLEAMARALFKSWFVDFDPVVAKSEGRQPEGMDAETAKLFPSSFENSEIGRVPKGWQVESLDNIANYLNGLALQKFPVADDKESIPVIKIAQLRDGNTTGADRASTAVPLEYIIYDGDILFSWSGSLTVVIWCGGCGALNQHLFKVTSKRFPKWFYYLWTLHHLPDFQSIAAGKATTMGHIQRHHLSAAKVLVPQHELLTAMDCHLEPLIEGIIRHRVESQTVTAMRDALLPRLLSGELAAT